MGSGASKQALKKLPRHANVAKSAGNEMRTGPTSSDSLSGTKADGEMDAAASGEPDRPALSAHQEETYLQNLSFLLNPKVTNVGTPVQVKAKNREVETIANRTDSDDFVVFNVKNKLDTVRIQQLLSRTTELEGAIASSSKSKGKGVGTDPRLETLATGFSVDKRILVDLARNFKNVPEAPKPEPTNNSSQDSR
ncbi:hypothetical protein AYI68_g5432 [Smittium mucronatum]|uniref:Uncharacterized protein n=1 Tax=Smittium mucronatum TaxID=133383 RepID=A0A1R0GU93_9FUNG|nr:hypothetical protein AYI68_g5432 [Smittium mucronatum]